MSVYSLSVLTVGSQVANHLNIHVIDVQRELMRLRVNRSLGIFTHVRQSSLSNDGSSQSLRQISIKWEQMAHVVQIHRWPSDLDELCVRTSAPRAIERSLFTRI